MANELDSRGEWQRLYDRYHAMSDEELLELAEDIGSLTETAGDVLRQEMRDRRLQVKAAVVAAPASVAASAAPRWTSSDESGTKRREVVLMTFHDAISAGLACDYLEEGEVDFEMRDLSQPQTGMRRFDSHPAVSLELLIDAKDKERAMAILREKMGLFPLQEVAVADELVDDGTTATLGNFGRRADAEEVARILEDAAIWHRIVANPKGSVENEDAYTLEVREVDLMRAGEVVEKAMELPEG
jgi:hypothetical protein